MILCHFRFEVAPTASALRRALTPRRSRAPPRSRNRPAPAVTPPSRPRGLPTSRRRLPPRDAAEKSYGFNALQRALTPVVTRRRPPSAAPSAPGTLPKGSDPRLGRRMPDPSDPAGTLQARRPRSQGGPAGARRGQEGGRRCSARWPCTRKPAGRPPSDSRRRGLRNSMILCHFRFEVAPTVSALRWALTPRRSRAPPRSRNRPAPAVTPPSRPRAPPTPRHRLPPRDAANKSHEFNALRRALTPVSPAGDPPALPLPPPGRSPRALTPVLAGGCPIRPIRLIRRIRPIRRERCRRDARAPKGAPQARSGGRREAGGTLRAGPCSRDPAGGPRQIPDAGDYVTP
jgi:hypothetical protein